MAIATFARPSRAWIAPAIAAGVFLVLLALVSQLPTICAAVYPAPPGCAPGARQGVALTWGIARTAVTAFGLVLIYLLPERARWLTVQLVTFVVVLVGLAAVVVTLFASGFAVSFWS